MDKATALVSIFGMATGVLITWAIAWGVVGGLKHRRGGQLEPGASAGDLAALRDQVDQLQQQLGEVHERLDFTERLLTRGHDEPREVS
jgi:hypothetical protein